MRATARSVALEVLCRIERDGAYANLALAAALQSTTLDQRDRAFVTDLVSGTTRMRRACDAYIDRHVLRPPDDDIRTILRLGTYQLRFAGVAPHAAVSETVELASKRTRGFVNAVLRRIADAPDRAAGLGERLSYPDWIVEHFIRELGEPDAVATLEVMNLPPAVHVRADGYTQDLSSQLVAELVDARPGERVLDLCAAPGGKATALAGAGAAVVAVDRSAARAGLVVGNARRVGVSVPVVVADGRRPPFTADSFDRVLVDAPCSGLGVLRRRADARWRVTPADLGDLAVLQQELIDAAAALVAPGGMLVYSVCTINRSEAEEHRFPVGWEPVPPSGPPWRVVGAAGRLLPHEFDADGMTLLRYRRPA